MSEIQFTFVCSLIGAAWGWIGVSSLDFWREKLFATSKPRLFDYFISGYLGPIQYLACYVLASAYGYNFYGKIR